MNSLPKLLDVQKISSGIIRILGQNASPYTLQGTNCYILGSGVSRVMVDTSSPSLPNYIDHLKQVLKNEKCNIEKIIITHWHPDHIGALSDVMQLSWMEFKHYPSVYKIESTSNPSTELTDVTVHHLRDGDIISNLDKDVCLRVVFTPGHTDDHICLHWDSQSCLFCGDLVLGHGTGVFENLTKYMQSLHHINEISGLQTLYSAHGDVISAPYDKINEYIQHRTNRINQVLHAIQLAQPDGIDCESLLDKVYPELTDVALKRGALQNMQQALDYLSHQNKIFSDPDQHGHTLWFLKLENKL